jgi:predicted Zn-dependent protease
MLILVRRCLPVLLLPVALLAQNNALLNILQEELNRNFEILKKNTDLAPYFLAYAVTEQETATVSAGFGALIASNHRRARILDITVRVGSPQLDNYHILRGELPRFTPGAAFPLDDNPNAAKLILWRETDRAFRAAAQRLINIKTNKEVVVAAAEASDDFSQEPAATFAQPPEPVDFDTSDWSRRLRKLSAQFNKYPGILASNVTLTIGRETKYLVTSEGTRLLHGRPYSRITISAASRAADGMDLSTFDSFSAADPKRLPKDSEIRDAIDRIARDLKGLIDAPTVEPFVGPAILSGRAAGVFFHEIFGHRVEGHRLKDESDGQTFAKSLNSPVLPDFISVTFDPTRRQLAGQDLNGWYQYDDEGVVARRLPLVEKGILKTFLMCRTPIPGIPNSNGHGRRQPGAEVVARQSNLLVEASRTVPEAKLKDLLIDELRRQNKPYGLYFQDITGGFTNTARRGINAFKVIPLVVYRIYPDGRQELVRGADIVGTPLASFAKILAAGDRLDVFNGFCGAESGDVPVAAVSPALLISEIEIQKKDSGRDRPPLLPAVPLSVQ